jgi:low affinity Fe/Cu permease
VNEAFHRFATRVSDLAGSAYAFFAALALVVGWLASGPFFGFSDTWQLVINTVTTISTGLMVFLIQHTQNRDTRAMQMKLDELVRAVEGARDELIGVERKE